VRGIKKKKGETKKEEKGEKAEGIKENLSRKSYSRIK